MYSLCQIRKRRRRTRIPNDDNWIRGVDRVKHVDLGPPPIVSPFPTIPHALPPVGDVDGTTTPSHSDIGYDPSALSGKTGVLSPLLVGPEFGTATLDAVSSAAHQKSREAARPEPLPGPIFNQHADAGPLTAPAGQSAAEPEVVDIPPSYNPAWDTKQQATASSAALLDREIPGSKDL